jgi:uncharacterized protein
MKTCVSKALVSWLLVTSTIAAACASERGGPRVVVHAAGGDVAVGVEVADTPSKRSFGLMYRRELADDAGMLFVFDETTVHSFWMKNTVLPLDMIFLDADRRVVGVVRDAVPFTTTPRSVDAPSRYVLEVHAGFGARHGIRAGDQVTFEGIPGGSGPP